VAVVNVRRLIRSLPDPPAFSRFLNSLIDEVFHPLAERYGSNVYLLDSLAHLIVETADTAALSLVKSVRYNLPRVALRGGRRGGRRGRVR